MGNWYRVRKEEVDGRRDTCPSLALVRRRFVLPWLSTVTSIQPPLRAPKPNSLVVRIGFQKRSKNNKMSENKTIVYLDEANVAIRQFPDGAMVLLPNGAVMDAQTYWDDF